MAPLPPPAPAATQWLVSTFFPIADNEFAGAVVVNLFAILSSIALLSIVIRVFWLLVQRLCGHSISHYRDYAFFSTQFGYYAACLLIANTANSVAGLMGLPFLIKRGIDEGALCTTQAVVMQFGNVASAYFTVVIGIHTFISLVLRKRQSVFVYAPAIFVGWALALVVSVLPIMIDIGKVYGVSGLSCGVKMIYGKTIFFFHLFPIFLAALSSAISYSVIFLLRGSLAAKGGSRLNNDNNDSYERFVAGIARSMLWYPVAYIVCLVPYAVVRLLSLVSRHKIPFAVTVVAFTLWFALGVVNAMLLYNTHRVLTPAFDGKTSNKKRQTEMSFGTLDAFKRLTTIAEMSPENNSSEKMINEYRRGFGGEQPFSPVIETSSQRGLLMNTRNGRASISSYYNSDIPETYARNITPVAELNKSLEAELPSSNGNHQHKDSSSTVASLPAPPRRLRTPPVALRPLETARSFPPPVHRSNPSLSSLSSRAQSPLPMYSDTAPEMTALNNHQNSSSIGSSVELDISGWLARQNPDGSMPSGVRNKPMLSAVQPSSPSPFTDTTTLPSAKLRPLLLASVERTGSPILAQHYRKIYSPTAAHSPR
ncbi:hypothetical protein E1B28_011446 [Marasmius oreades]|uniref:G-protein coupled receptors family 2 profile 2 domain-containing protein n=1 Tax=Marasmius oreades TaxID=181124 RepID=A0A9P7RV57_9AGAR|nr:uncharacterized protein E1B28_011446 [Marasmius oreades]KAG7089796.1 hypothetical protein E1B28_011446 [Marasmius oreades]